MSRSAFRLLASFALTAFAFVACVGGPGSLPNSGENPDVEKSGTGKSGSTKTAPTTTGTVSPPTTTTASPPPPPSNSKTISASESDWTRECTIDSDCTLVFQGAVCSPCKCSSGAIARKDEGVYNNALAERSSDCGDPGDVNCSPCQALTAICSPSSKQCSVTLSKK